MNSRSSIPEAISLEVQALAKVHKESLTINNEINILQLEAKETVIESATKSILNKENPLTFDEISLLIGLYPKRVGDPNGLVLSLNEILLSEKTNPYYIADIMLTQRHSNYCLSLVEKLNKQNRFNHKAHEYNSYLIRDNQISHEILNQKTVEDWQARLLLASVSTFNPWGEPEVLDYVKVFAFLKRSPRYSDLTNLHFDTYEFAKFYSIQHLSQQKLGTDKLPLNRRKIITLHPPAIYAVPRTETTLHEITISENIAKGEEVYLFLASSNLVTAKNMFEADLLKTTQKDSSEYSIIPAFNTVIVEVQGNTPQSTQTFNIKEELKLDYTKGFLEKPSRLKIFVKDSEAPIVKPESIKLTISSEPGSPTETEMILVGETHLNGNDLTLNIGNPVSVKVSPISLNLPKLNFFKIYLDKLNETSHIHIEIQTQQLPGSVQ